MKTVIGYYSKWNEYVDRQLLTTKSARLDIKENIHDIVMTDIISMIHRLL